MLFWSLVDASPNSPYLLVQTQNVTSSWIPVVLNTNMHSSTAQTGSSLVLTKYLAAQALPLEITESILDFSYLEDDTVWHFFFVCLQTCRDLKGYF